MRHRVYGRKLGRNKNERTSLFRNLMQELFLHGTITTSKSKAAAIKGTVDKIITIAKDKNSQRLLQSFFSDRLLQQRIIKDIAPKLTNRTSGYTTTMKVGVRSDSTTLVKMSLIGLEQLKPLEKKAPIKKEEAKEVKKVVAEKKVVKKATPVKAKAVNAKKATKK